MSLTVLLAVVAALLVGLVLARQRGSDAGPPPGATDPAASPTTTTTAPPPTSTTPTTIATTTAVTVPTTVPIPTAATVPATAPSPTIVVVVPSPRRCPRLNDVFDLPIQMCDEGYIVQIVQQALVNAGLPVEVDSQYGPASEAAVKAFQARSGLAVDGIVGPNTWRALYPYMHVEFGNDDNRDGVIMPDEIWYD